MSGRLWNPKYLVSHWRLNNNALDGMKRNHGEWVGTEDYDDGPFGHSVGKFDGTNDSISIDDPIGLNLVNEMTFSALVNVAAFSANGESIFSKRTGTDQQYLFRIANGGLLRFEYYNGGWRNVQSTSGVSVGKWAYVAVAWKICDSSAQYNFYIDGDDAGSGTSSEFLVSYPESAVMIGYDNSGTVDRHFQGQIGVVRVYNCALSADEVKELHHRDIIR